MKVSDAQVTRALQTFYRDFSSTDFDQDVEDAMRAVLEDVIDAVPEPEYEYGTPYAHMWKAGSRTADAWKSEEGAREMVEESNGERILVRRPVVEWEEAEG